MTFDQISALVNSAFRDFTAFGVPASGAWEPVKQEIRTALNAIVIGLEDGGFEEPVDWAEDLAAVLAKLETIDAAVAATAADRVQTGLDVTATTTAKNDAQAAATAAIAAAAASGPTFFYDTKALATAALGAITANAVVDVFADETHNGHHTRYRKESGVLVFKLDLSDVSWLSGTTTLSGDTTYGLVNLGDSGVIKPNGHDLTLRLVDTRRIGIFDMSSGGTVTILDGFVRPEWFGDIEDSWIMAHDALPASGGIIELANRRYKKNAFAYHATTAGAVFISKPNIWLKGAGKPTPENDLSGWIDGTGTICDGYLLAWADNVVRTDFCMDAGDTVTTAQFAGVGPDANCLTFPSDEAKAACQADQSLCKKGGYSARTWGLCASPAEGDHAFIGAEGVTGHIQEDCGGIYGLHAYVNKATDSIIRNPSGWLAGAELLIVKSDQAGISNDVTVEGGNLWRDGPPEFSPHTLAGTDPIGFNVNPDTEDLTGLRVRGLKVHGEVSNGLFLAIGASSGDLLDADIEMESDGAVVAGALLGNAHAKVVELKLKMLAKNSPVGVYDGLVATNTLDLDVHARDCFNAVSFAGDNVTFAATTASRIVAENCLGNAGNPADTTKGGAVRMLFAAKPKITELVLLGTTPRVFATDGSGGAPALAGTWASTVGEKPFSVTWKGSKLVFGGYVTPGSTTTIATLPPGLRPTNNQRFSALANNAGTVTDVTVTVATTGDVVINEFGGSYTAATTWLCLEGIALDLG